MTGHPIDDETKLQIRKLRAGGLSATKVARRLGIDISTVYRWQK